MVELRETGGVEWKDEKERGYERGWTYKIDDGNKKESRKNRRSEEKREWGERSKRTENKNRWVKRTGEKKVKVGVEAKKKKEKAKSSRAG